MTISITVIVLESTGNVVYLYPIAFSIMFAKLVGDFFTDGIYDLHVGLKGYPVLPDQPPDERAHLQASDVMESSVRTVQEHEQVGTLLKLLRTTSHHGFPVAARGGGGGVLGIILRDQLVTILSRRRFESRRSASPHLGSFYSSQHGPGTAQPPLSADDFLRPWKEINLEQLALTFTPEDLAKVVNLRPYINEAALVTLRTTSLRRVSRLFLTMGLRHLLVVESNPKVVGVITRKDLIYAGGDEQSNAALHGMRPDNEDPSLLAAAAVAAEEPPLRWLRRRLFGQGRPATPILIGSSRTASAGSAGAGGGPAGGGSRTAPLLASEAGDRQQRSPILVPIAQQSPAPNVI